MQLQKVTLCLSTAWRYVGGVEVYLHSFLIATEDGGEWWTSLPCHFIPRKEPGTNWTGGCVSTRVRPDDFEKKENLCHLQEFEARITQPVP